MPRSSSVPTTSLTKKTLSFIKNISWIDWLVSILLVAAIVFVAVWVCNHPDKETDGNEKFSGCGVHTGYPGAHDSEVETFESNATKDAVVVKSTEHLRDSIGSNEIGCCLVYYERCGHCQAFKPTWKETCNELQGTKVNGKKIKLFECGDDHDMEIWKDVSDSYGIQGYPTILVKIGGKDADWREYTGSRNAVASYLKEQ